MTISEEVFIHPFWLHFSNHELESKYREWRVRSTLLGIDHAFACVNITIFTIFAVIELYNNSERIGLMLLAAGLLTYLIQLIVIGTGNGKLWFYRRNQFIVILRTIRVVISVFGVPYWIKGAGEDWPTLYRTLFVGSGAMINVWMAFGSPLIFQFHLYLHLPLVLLMMVTTGWSTCDRIILNEETGSMRIALVIQNVDAFINGFLSPSPMVIVNSEEDRRTECCRLITLVYLILSLTTPSFLLWKLEIHSRISFMKFLDCRANPEFQNIRFDCSWIPHSSIVFIALTLTILIPWTLL